MSLLVMPPNIQEADASARKRCHDEFVEPGCNETFRFETSGFVKKPAAPAGESEKENQFTSTTDSRASTLQNSPAPRTEPRSSPPQSPFPNATPIASQDISKLTSALQTPTGPPSSAQTPAQPPAAEPPAKKKRLTKEEKAAKDEEMARKKQEREADKAAKAAERAKKDAEKAQKDAERKKKAEGKEKERRKKEEEEARKARSQPKLISFFNVKPATPKKTTAIKTDPSIDDASPWGTPSKDAAKEHSAYEQMFQPFFLKEHVTVARVHDTDMDEETREAKSRILDEYIQEKRGEIQVKPFDPMETFQLPCLGRRGRSYPSVRKIMAESGDNRSHKPVDVTTESQNTQIREAREALREIPMKLLSFKEDVRPPYYGTVTNHPSGMAGLRRLGRNPISKDILPLAYDYDSEAEWQDDDGEDIEALDDDDDDPDNDEDMDDFLDDSEDAGLIRPAFGGGLEPESSGIRWENCLILPPSPHMYKFRMEFILDSLNDLSCIDPFSSSYWEPAPSTTTKSAAAPTAKQAAPASGSAMAPPPAPTDAFQALAGLAAAAPKKSTAVLTPDLQEKLKVLVMANPLLSRVGTIELFSSQHDGCSKAAIKATLELVAEKVAKSWRLKAAA